MTPKKLTPLTLDEALEQARKHAEEFAKLPPEEQRRRNEEKERILAKLRGRPGFTEVIIKPKKP